MTKKLLQTFMSALLVDDVIKDKGTSKAVVQQIFLLLFVG